MKSIQYSHGGSIHPKSHNFRSDNSGAGSYSGADGSQSGAGVRGFEHFDSIRGVPAVSKPHDLSKILKIANEQNRRYNNNHHCKFFTNQFLRIN